MRSRLLMIVGAAVATLACASAAVRPAVPGTPDAEGERLYRGHCGGCHALRNPGDHSRQRWAWAVDKFSGRAHLSPDEAGLVLAYLQARAKDAPPVPDAASASPPAASPPAR